MQVTRTSALTGVVRTKYILGLTDTHFMRMLNGELIQDVLHFLSEDDREFIMTGITSEEWDEAFKEEEGQ